MRSRSPPEELERWLRATLGKLPPKSAAAATIQYTLNLWPALLLYRDDGIDQDRQLGCQAGIVWRRL